MLFGAGGVGKTELCAHLKQIGLNPQFIDAEDGTKFLDVARVEPLPESWDDIRQAAQDEDIWAGYDCVVVDSLTKCEERAAAWVIQNIKTEKNLSVSSIEGYGFGKGYTHVYETFLKLLGDLDAHIRKGRHVVCIAHDCAADVPNPAGEDYLQFQPRLQCPGKGKSSIRHQVKEWADHLLFIGFDIMVDADGKATGSGSRCIYPTELPTWWAKSRTLSDPVPYLKDDAEIWRRIFNK